MVQTWVSGLFTPDGLTPHGFCLLWEPWLIWSHAFGDVATSLAYFFIPMAIVRFTRRRHDLVFKPVFWLFAAFILLCGSTHIMDLVTLWVPLYRLGAVLCLATAVASVATAVALWLLIPQALAVPSPAQLEAANRALSEREASFRLLAEHASDMVARIAPDGSTGYVSPASLRIFGIPAEALLGAGLMPIMHPDDRATALDSRRRLLAGEVEESCVEFRIRRPDGAEAWVGATGRLVRDCATGAPDGYIELSRDITDRMVAAARISHLAHHDPLTGLANRSLFAIRLNEAVERLQRGERFAICYMDLDHFKDVNDMLGHPVGDNLLRAVASRLKAAVRSSDTVARLGGDEFAIIQTNLERDGDCATLAERLIALIETPFDLDDHHVAVGTSIGIAMAPEDGQDGDRLLQHADMALYAAKESGRGQYRFFEAEMDTRVQAKHALEVDLRASVAAGEFELFYQPILSVSTQLLLGFEALLRWRHPVRGLVLPGSFVPLTETNGLIVPIGAWALRRACADAAGWPSQARVSVNLSVVQFASPTLVQDVLEALALSGLEPHRLELEITETIMLQDTEATLAVLHRLKALGITVAMDDFGTGYSSLSYLRRFPFDKVKIDRSFIVGLDRTPESRTIVRALIDLCKGLDIRTTAEGVETEDQLALLASIGCTEAQGYHFARPSPANEVDDLIARFEPGRRSQRQTASHG